VLKISIIIPVLNEAGHLEEVLKQALGFQDEELELIVVDGGSNDDTVAVAKRHTGQVVVSDRGRAKQMNAGADVANGDILLFLHADTVLSIDSCELIKSKISNDHHQWGRFDVRLSGDNKLFRIIEFFINWRSRISSIATGDQAIFVCRKLFDEIGGFPEMPLMEDIEISKRLKRVSKPICITSAVITSTRRWEEHGILRTVLLMWQLRFLYFIGVSPERLIKHYR